MPGGHHEHMKAWDPEEDHSILEMVTREGTKWSSIVSHLPGRSVASVRNRYQRIEKGRKLREQGSSLIKNRCHMCNQPKRGHICYAKMRGGPQVDVSPSMHGVAPPIGGAPTTMVGKAVLAHQASLPSPPDSFKLWPEAPATVSFVPPPAVGFEVPPTNLRADADGSPATVIPAGPSASQALYAIPEQAAPPILAHSASSLLKDLVNVAPEILSRPSLLETPVPPKLGCSVSSFMRDFMDTSATLTTAPTA